MDRGSLRTGLLALLVLAAGLGAWALLGIPEAPERPPLQDEEPIPAPATPEDGEPRPAAERAADGPEAVPAPPASAPAVPRLLPADAALEDLRDALALAPEERQRALDGARLAMGRVAAARRKVLLELHALIEDEEDPLLRAVATSTLGTSREDGNVRWLQTRLAAGPALAERLGALLALATPDPDAGRERAGTLRAQTLGGLTCEYAALPDGASMLAAVARFLDAVQPAQARDAFPVVLHSVKTSVHHAALLVGGDGKLRHLALAISEVDRDTLRAAALAHRDLPGSVRRALAQTR